MKEKMTLGVKAKLYDPKEELTFTVVLWDDGELEACHGRSSWERQEMPHRWWELARTALAGKGKRLRVLEKTKVFKTEN
ncbi:hypothetical protein [Terasakiella sp. SH-1]|uniref:hypothetical protein n=1 Tax=Terasakiella sp. SH-1 TaxID=2560057 RepID=UPI00107386F5|nr:hypothetical protein [Terasakiella sp. SH-1]